ncbi:membrane protein [gut metagenome]|uniref:Membrane protein n=1 Tax=gut metagenome TaxID=749906 RepID=J9GTH9_9ZZZZ
MIAKPPASLTSFDSLISVPRPAMLVAMVTVLFKPAKATISASFWCNLAFNTLCCILRIVSIRLNSSDISTDVVPTNTGRPAFVSFTISSITALYFSRFVL